MMKMIQCLQNDSREAQNVKKIKKKCPHLSKYSTKERGCTIRENKSLGQGKGKESVGVRERNSVMEGAGL